MELVTENKREENFPNPESEIEGRPVVDVFGGKVYLSSSTYCTG